MRRWLLLGVLLGWPGRAGAQQDSLLADSLLAEASRLATEGQGDSARALVRARLGSLAPSDASYPAALYAAGLVAAQGDSAAWYFRRVSIEYSQSPWAAPALLRLAQFAFASGDFAQALALARRVLSDYPVSRERAGAAYWAGRAALELRDLPAACGLLQQAEVEAGPDVEAANRARFYLQRCRVVGPAPAESAASAVAAAVFSVQVAAVRSAAAADELMRTLAQQGYQPRVVREPDGLLKVRVGLYRSRAEAQRVAAELRRRLGGSPFVVEETQP